MTRTNRRLLAVLASTLGPFLAASTEPPAAAAPPWLEGLGQYRIVDASGRIAPRTDPAAPGRVVLRPAYPPSPLLRGNPLFLSGYAGATYGPRRLEAPYAATSYRAGGWHRHTSGWRPAH